MTRFQPSPVALALGLALASPAFAQTTRPDSDTVLTVGQVVVSGAAAGPLEARRLLTSVDVLPTERIESQVTGNNWELLGQVPGVMLTQFGQGTTSGKFSMRGFNMLTPMPSWLLSSGAGTNLRSPVSRNPPSKACRCRGRCLRVEPR